jgi:hypothetical protein
MAIPHAKPGEIVDVRPLGSAMTSAQTKTLVRAEQVEVIRLIVPAGKEIDEHKAKGEIVVQCLEGKVAFTAFGKTQNLEARMTTCVSPTAQVLRLYQPQLALARCAIHLLATALESARLRGPWWTIRGPKPAQLAPALRRLA